ncbi:MULTISPECIES: sialidase family protein [Galbibacter]|uniref:exo-alpha-sialidase n=1 Tax=Galbibacter pacificus TaxID=2996052 RepID=A0ABT6FN06_9FLAO|nr:sialidase family protein [Galbibacter pacificus]MDG3581112.1 sialidase family protein [Galbibacter pacificus]MDG3584590.1 sialidase family protein [Galbibacter pacificus]
MALLFSNCVEDPGGSLIVDEDNNSSDGTKYPGSDGINFIYEKGQEGYSCYRIPALLNIDDEVLLSFAEARKNNCSDTGDIDLVVKRSTDGGATWSENIMVWNDGGNTCGNPAPVYDAETGEIVLLASWNNGNDDIGPINSGTSIDTRRVYVIRSGDQGLTWSEPEEITVDVKLNNWRWYATGPGSGIQVTKGTYKGRLLVGCDYIDAQRKGYSHVIYSDDHGGSWKIGGISPEPQTNECEIAELSNGSLMLNMRNSNSGDKRRKVAISQDGGENWDYLGLDNTLITPIVQASLHRYSFEGDLIDENILLFSNPADFNDRKNMTVRLSNDDGQTWSKSLMLHNGFAAYSDLANYKDYRAAILYETGETEDDRYDGISFETFSLDKLK